MKVSELIAELQKFPGQDAEVFVECPETCGSWSTKGVVVTGLDRDFSKKVIIIRINECDGPVTPIDFND